MSTRLIGLVGYSRAGKDTVANILNEHYGFARVGFADALKEMLYELDPIVDRDMRRVSTIVNHGGWEYAKGLTEVRALLQRLGTEAGRKALGEDVWIDTAMRKVNDILRTNRTSEGYQGVVITDVRFENEATRISDEGGVLIYIHRGERVNDHASEDLAAEMADFYNGRGKWIEDYAVNGAHRAALLRREAALYHHVIDNTGSLAVLHAKVHDLAMQLELTKQVRS